MKLTKVMQRLFSDSETDKEFKQKVGEAIDLANTEGSSRLVEEDPSVEKVDLSVEKLENGKFSIKDNDTDEVTIATVNENDPSDVKLEIPEETTDPVPAPAPEEPKKEEEGEGVVITEVIPGEEYEVKTSTNSYSVKGNLRKAIDLSKAFSSKAQINLLEVNNVEPEVRYPASTGIVDPEKAGTPATRSFSVEEAVEKAKEEAKNNPEGALVNTEKGTYHCKATDKGFSWSKLDFENKTFSEVSEEEVLDKETHKDSDINEVIENAKEKAKNNPEGSLVTTEKGTYHCEATDKGFSWTKLDFKSKNFSEIPEIDIVKENEGTPVEPEINYEAKTGIENDEKAGAPEARSFSDEVENEVVELEKKAEEVSEQPTEENTQTLKEDSEKLADKIEKTESFSTVRRNSLLSRVKMCSEVAEEACKNLKGEEEPSEEELEKSFSTILNSGVRTFARPTEMPKVETTEVDNPLLNVKF